MIQGILPLISSLVSPATIVIQGKKEISEKKRNGIFYTPEKATQILTRWAIQNSTERILEPSFGGCGFLIASRNRLVELGNHHPEQSLYGCDIDPAAFDYLGNLFKEPDNQQHFKKIDFLTTTESDFPVVSAVVGNPPYVSLHNMSVPQRALARSISESAGVAINGRASLWTYFVLHSLSFLEPGGRMAWILPGSFIYSEYSEPLRRKLEQSFGRSIAILLEDRIFVEEGTDESSVVLLCESFQAQQTNTMRLTSVKGLAELEHVIQFWTENQLVGNDWTERPQLTLINSESRNCYLSLLRRADCYRFGDFAVVKIGIVTGNNKFFVLSESQALKENLPRTVLEPIMARFAHAEGLELTVQDIEHSRQQDLRCLLLDTRFASDIEEVKVYLATYPEDKINDNVTYKSRHPWHQIRDRVYPDAFFSSMQAEGPILMLNTAGVACTNTVYQVQIERNLFAGFTPKLRMLAVSLQSTFSQFSAEIEGRSFGHGALKVEPSEAKRIALLLKDDAVGLDDTFVNMDACFRRGDRTAARQLADSWLIQNGLLDRLDIELLQKGLVALRTMRSGYRKVANL